MINPKMLFILGSTSKLMIVLEVVGKYNWTTLIFEGSYVKTAKSWHMGHLCVLKGYFSLLNVRPWPLGRVRSR